MALDRPLQSEIAAAMDSVRKAPDAIAPRMALFQLACVVADWRRARTQLDAMAKLDSDCMLLARTYIRLIEAEAVRTRVFAGEEQPVAFGEPSAWLAMTAQALTLDRTGDQSGAHALREAARQEAPARPGTVDGHVFEWFMDADPRMGAALEVVVEGQYRWLPLHHLRELRANPPKAMRDIVWQPVTLVLTTDAELAAFIPSRYPGSDTQGDDAVRLCRETRWIGVGQEQWGLGQRLFATDQDDYALLDIRRLRFDGSVRDGDA